MSDFVQPSWRQRLQNQKPDTLPIYDIAVNWATDDTTGQVDFELLYTAVHTCSRMQQTDDAAIPFARHRDERGLLYRSGGTYVILDINEARKRAAELQEVLRELVHERLAVFHAARAAELYDPFLNLLLRQGGAPQLDLFTTNYDRSVESIWADATDTAHRPLLIDGFEQLNRQRGREFSPGSYARSASEGPTVRLYKLHGSLYWSRADGHVVRTPNHHYLGNNALIYPLRGKQGIEEPFSTLFDLFERALAEARLIVIVGHSLRDERIADAIAAAIRTNGALRVLVCDLHPETPLHQLPTDLHGRCTSLSHHFGSTECLSALSTALSGAAV